ncbi:MAG: signal peptidase II [Bacteroidota bacterium]
MTTNQIMKRRLPWVIGIIGIMVALDQLTKVWAVNNMQRLMDPIEYLGGLFNLTYVENRGAFLSLGNDLAPGLRMVLLNVLPALLLIGMLAYILRNRSLDRLQVIGLSSIVGGGLSNIVDRIAQGYVVDFMHMKGFGLQTGIFNVADLAIVFGMILILPSMIKGEKKAETKPEEAVQEQVDKPEVASDS